MGRFKVDLAMVAVKRLRSGVDRRSVYSHRRPGLNVQGAGGLTIKGTRIAVLELGSTALVAVAAAMWAADAYFRPALVNQLSASQIVLVEDLLISLCLLPVLIRGWWAVRRLSQSRLLAILIIAAGPQALATVLFTKSIGYAFSKPAAPDFDVLHEVYLLYLAQPVFGLLFAWLILGERRRWTFWPIAMIALLGAYLIVFADEPGAPWRIHHPEFVAALLVLGAVCLWGSGTALGRLVLQDLSYPVMAALRFACALPVLLLIALFENRDRLLSGYTLEQLPNFLGIVLVPGLLAMLLYYLALSKTPASLATIAELGYPCALFLIFSLPPPVGQGTPIRLLELVGAALVAGSVLALNFMRLHRVVVTPQPVTMRPLTESLEP